MNRWIRSVVTLGLLAITFVWTACGGGGSGGSGLRVQRATQNVTVDPSGATLDVTFSQAVDSVSAQNASNYTGSGGQHGTTASLQGDGRTVRVTFDEAMIAGMNTLTVAGVRSSTGNGIVSKSGLSITSSDTTPPTASGLVAEAVQAAANDRITVTFDKGMVESDVLDLHNYQLQNPVGNVLDIANSQITWDVGTFTVTIVLTNTGSNEDNLQTGQSVSLRLAEGMRDVSGNRIDETTLTGTVTGDSEGPSLLTATQNVTFDPQGRTVDVLFSEEVDVADAETTANYVASEGQQVTSASCQGALVRLQFSATVVPGTTTLDVHGVADLAGNDMFTVSGVVLTGTDTTPPNMTGVAATTIANRANDTFQISFDEQVLRADAEDVGRYVLQAPSGTTLDPNSMTASYDQNTRTVTITLDGTGAQAVDLQTGADFVVEVFSMRDVGGNALGYATMTGTVTGDVTPPILKSVTQDTTLEPDGTILALEFDEDVASLPAFQTANFSAGDAPKAILSMIHPLQPNVVLVQFDDVFLPGFHTLDVANQSDLAGNVAAPFTGWKASASEKEAPTLYAVLAKALPGERNDWILLTFTEPMYAPDVTNLSNYTFHNPAVRALTLGNSSVTYLPAAWSVRITLDQSGTSQDNLFAGQDLVVTVRDVRDVAGNAVSGMTQTTTTVQGDAEGPDLVSAWQNLTVDGSGATTDVVFDEALDITRAENTTNWTMVGGHAFATAATVVGNEDIVRITWSAPVIPGTHELAFQNIADKAGNLALPMTGVPIAADDTTPPGTLTSSAYTTEGVSGDGLQVTFDEDMHPGDATNPANYSVNDGGGNVPSSALSEASFDYSPETRTVSVTFGPTSPYDFTNGQGITIDMMLLRDAHGNVQGLLSETPIPAGDSTVPAVTAVRQDATALDSVYVQFQDVVDPSSVDASDFVHATWNVLGVQVVEPHTVLVQFDGDLTPGVDTLDIAGISDLAGNVMPGAATVAIVANDTQAPTVSVSAEAITGEGNDVIRVQFSEPVNPAQVMERSRYVLQSPMGTNLDLQSASFHYDAQSTTLSITLWRTQWLTQGASFSVTVLDVEDVAGNPLATTQAGTVTGDTTSPTLLWIDRNEIEDPSGSTVDLYFDEPMDPAMVSQLTSYSSSGGFGVASATNLYDRRIVRVVFNGTVQPGSHTMTVSGQRDLAGNAMVTQNGVAIQP